MTPLNIEFGILIFYLKGHLNMQFWQFLMQATAFPIVFVIVEVLWKIVVTGVEHWLKGFSVFFRKLIKRCYCCDLVLLHQNCQHPVCVCSKSFVTVCHMQFCISILHKPGREFSVLNCFILACQGFLQLAQRYSHC